MNAARPIFLLLGFASEYSLGTIARQLRDVGKHVIEVDFSKNKIPDLGDAEVVLITSQHPARTAWIFRHSYGQTAPYDSYQSPMECLRQLNVCCSVFVPHDLEQPIIEDEIAYLSFFDFYCSPYEFTPGLELICRPLYTGWAKHTDFGPTEFPYQPAARMNGVFFVNQLTKLMHRGGAACLLEEYAVAVNHEVPFKLPDWPGVADIERELKQAGAIVIPADTLSTQVIAHSSQIFSNAAGSVLAEAAYLGIPAHIIAPRSTDLPAPSQKRCQRQPFDFHLLIQSIQNHLDGTGRP